jgi:hypothetical protein
MLEEIGYEIWDYDISASVQNKVGRADKPYHGVANPKPDCLYLCFGSQGADSEQMHSD